MTLFLIFVLGGLIFLLEKFGTPLLLDMLSFHVETDTILAEPGQKITLTSTVENKSKLPVPFIRLQIPFPVDAEFDLSSKWSRRHLRDGFRNRFLEERFTLKKQQKSLRTMTFTMPHRGVYTIGPYRLSAGDLLGITEASKSGDGLEITVMPEYAKNRQLLQAFGGFLGDISVRRFLLEDPILTAGFRDYSGSDPMKSISWTRTAQTSTLQVKQFDHTAEEMATVLLDTEGGTEEELEACFRLTRSVCQQLENRKIPYDLRTNGNLTSPTGKLFHLPEGLGQHHLNTLLYALGRADYMNFFTREQLVRRTMERRKVGGFTVVITPNLQGSNAFSPLYAVGPVCILEGRRELE